jgi:hypothetical protein
MAGWYQTYVAGPGRSAVLWALIGFLVTYSLTRWITRRIRARCRRAPGGRSAVKDVYIGGVHIHHQVWGILLVLVTGLLEFRFRPHPPWQEVLARAVREQCLRPLDRPGGVYLPGDRVESRTMTGVGAPAVTFINGRLVERPGENAEPEAA